MFTLKIIIALSIVVLVFILLRYFTPEIDPKDKAFEKPRSQRIFMTIIGVIMIAGEWIQYPAGSLLVKVLWTLLWIILIYRALNGWLFKSTVKEGDPD